jgi:simple sugar transport system permease protein
MTSRTLDRSKESPVAIESAHSWQDTLGNFVRRPEMGSLIGLVAVFAFFSIFGGSSFLTAQGASTWLNVASELGIIALPIGLLMIAGQLDLSVGSMVPASSMTLAIIAGHYHLPAPIGVVASLAFGLAVGFVNGLLVIRTKVPSFVVTLATLFALAV